MSWYKVLSYKEQNMFLVSQGFRKREVFMKRSIGAEPVFVFFFSNDSECAVATDVMKCASFCVLICTVTRAIMKVLFVFFSPL